MLSIYLSIYRSFPRHFWYNFCKEAGRVAKYGWTIFGVRYPSYAHLTVECLWETSLSLCFHNLHWRQYYYSLRILWGMTGDSRYDGPSIMPGTERLSYAILRNFNLILQATGSQWGLKIKNDRIRSSIYKAITGEKKLKTFRYFYSQALSQKELFASKSFKSLRKKEKDLG